MKPLLRTEQKLFFHKHLSGYLWLIRKKIVVYEIIEAFRSKSQRETVSLANNSFKLETAG